MSFMFSIIKSVIQINLGDTIYIVITDIQCIKRTYTKNYFHVLHFNCFQTKTDI